jgi:hypothetical protein
MTLILNYNYIEIRIELKLNWNQVKIGFHKQKMYVAHLGHPGKHLQVWQSEYLIMYPWGQD